MPWETVRVLSGADLLLYRGGELPTPVAISPGKAAGGGSHRQSRTSEPESVVGAGRQPRAEQRRPPRAH